jgi:hypothetical protein
MPLVEAMASETRVILMLLVAMSIQIKIIFGRTALRIRAIQMDMKLAPEPNMPRLLPRVILARRVMGMWPKSLLLMMDMWLRFS